MARAQLMGFLSLCGASCVQALTALYPMIRSQLTVSTDALLAWHGWVSSSPSIMSVVQWQPFSIDQCMGTSASSSSRVRTPTGIEVTPKGRQAPQRLGGAAEPFAEPRRVVVGVGQARIDGERAIVRCERLVGGAAVLEHHRQVEPGGGVRGRRGDRPPVVRLGRRQVAGDVKQPPQVDVRPHVVRIDLERAPVRLDRLLNRRFFEVASTLVPLGRRG